MKRITKLLMVLLSSAPIATIAVAAHAKASEIEGEIQTTKLRSAAQTARYRLIPTGEVGTTMMNAIDRYSKITGLEGEPLRASMTTDLQTLKQAGLIEFDEKMIMSGGRSEHQML